MFPGGSSPLAAPRQLRQVVITGARFAKKNALLLKVLPTGFGFAFGDFLTQYMQWRNGPRRVQEEFKWELHRAAKMAAVGAFIAIPMFGMLKAMDTHAFANPNGITAVTVKFTVEQVIGCLLWQFAYMYIHPPYRKAAEQLLVDIQSKYEVTTEDFKRSFEVTTGGIRRKLQLDSV